MHNHTLKTDRTKAHAFVFAPHVCGAGRLA
jgi:hypothetical protein